MSFFLEMPNPLQLVNMETYLKLTGLQVKKLVSSSTKEKIENDVDGQLGSM